MAERASSNYGVWIEGDEDRRNAAPLPELPPLGPLRAEDIEHRQATPREMAIINYESARISLCLAAADFGQHVPGDGVYGLRRWPGSQKKLLDAADRYAAAQARMQKVEEGEA